MVSMKKILLILGVLFAVQLAVIYAFKIPQGPKGETGPIGPADHREHKGSWEVWAAPRSEECSTSLHTAQRVMA